MTQPNPNCYHMSASSISSFKACPQRFRLAYREGIRIARDTDALRMGTNWHALHEAYQGAVREWERSDKAGFGGHDTADDFGMAAAAAWLTESYAEVPSWKTLTEWETERIILLRSFVCYLWYWNETPIEYLADEVRFELPLIDPVVGMPLPVKEVLTVGMIDHVIRYQGMVGNLERKSTAQGIDPSSRYWEKLHKDTQVSIYALSFADMKLLGLETYGIEGVKDDERTGNTLYDVWHKPSSKPKAISQKDSKALVDTGRYFDEVFTVEVTLGDVPEQVKDKETKAMVPTGNMVEGVVGILVDGDPVEWEPGAKPLTYAIKESPGMFGARLAADIVERPEFYFARKEIPRTASDLIRFRKELYNIYQAQKMYADSGTWYENEHACSATFNCQYIPICYGGGADSVCDGETTPDGFKRIFVDLTVKETEPDAA